MSTPATRNATVDVRVSLQLLPRLWWLLALLPVAWELFLGLHHLKHSWDDGAITAAFSRTWAESGKIALTPVSQTVEGFSTVLWFLLLSIPYFFTHNPDAGLIWMKVLSAIFFLLSLRLIYVVAWRQFADRAAAIVSVLLLAYCTTLDWETRNGMEMTLAVFLLLLLFHIFTSRQRKWRILYASILCFLLLLARFEMPFILALFFCGFFYAAWRNMPNTVTLSDLFRISAITLSCFILIEFWRHHAFGEWMPNTVYAKRFPPYSDWSTPAKFVHTRLKAMSEPISVLLLPLGFAACAYIMRAISLKKTLWITSDLIPPTMWALALGCFLFGAMFGQNWGPPGRMVAALLPFLILVIVGISVNAVPDKRLLAKALTILLIGHSLVWLRQQAAYPVDATIDTIAPIGLGADSIRAALHHDQMVTMISDVGASSLCCERLDIVDSALLANPTLARTGWSSFPSYFRSLRPEVVEAHANWPIRGHLYDEGLLDDYSIVSSHGVRFFVRNDLFSQLIAGRSGSILPVTSDPACMATRPRWNSKLDTQFSISKRTCLVLNGPSDGAP